MVKYRLLKVIGLVVFCLQVVILVSRAKVKREDFSRAGTRIKNGAMFVASAAKDGYGRVETRVRDAMERD